MTEPKKKVVCIRANNLPAKLPLFPSLTAYLVLDHFNAPQWLYGAVGLLFAIVWIASIYCLFVAEDVDLLEGHRK